MALSYSIGNLVEEETEFQQKRDGKERCVTGMVPI